LTVGGTLRPLASPVYAQCAGSCVTAVTVEGSAGVAPSFGVFSVGFGAMAGDAHRGEFRRVIRAALNPEQPVEIGVPPGLVLGMTWCAESMKVPPRRTQQPSRCVTIRLSCRHSAVWYGDAAEQVRLFDARASRPQTVKGRKRGIRATRGLRRA